MLYKIARALQFIGMIILPCAISGNLAEKLTLWQSLIMSGIGIAIFYMGYLLQGACPGE